MLLRRRKKKSLLLILNLTSAKACTATLLISLLVVLAVAADHKILPFQFRPERREAALRLQVRFRSVPRFRVGEAARECDPRITTFLCVHHERQVECEIVLRLK